MQASVDVIVVNYNAGAVLNECVSAVLASDLVSTLTVVDNASTDGSMATLEPSYEQDQRLRLICNGNNIGFAGAVNSVARHGSTDYVLVLNPDCIVGKGAIERMQGVLDNDRLAAVAGPWVTDRSGDVQQGTWRRLPDPLSSFLTVSRIGRLFGGKANVREIDVRTEVRPDQPVVADAVSGACMLIRRSAGDQVDWFDERYAMHCEDLDLMHRLRTRGHHCVLVPGATAVHLQGVSSAGRPFWVHWQKHRGMQRYFRKFQAGDHSPPFRGVVYAGIWLHYLLTLPAIALGRLKLALT